MLLRHHNKEKILLFLFFNINNCQDIFYKGLVVLNVVSEEGKNMVKITNQELMVEIKRLQRKSDCSMLFASIAILFSTYLAVVGLFLDTGDVGLRWISTILLSIIDVFAVLYIVMIIAGAINTQKVKKKQNN